jgi:hypothetical protein
MDHNSAQVFSGADKIRRRCYCSLTPPEMQIIADYINQETDTQYFNPTDGVSEGLAARGLI